MALLCVVLGTIGTYKSQGTVESGIYALNLMPITKWSAKTDELGRVKTIWPNGLTDDRNWGKSIGYFNREKNRFYICSRTVRSESIQSKYLRLINAHLSNSSGSGRAFILGISTGDKSELSEDDIQLFRDAGLAHILAVSGYHVGLVGFIPLLLIRSRQKWLRIFAVIVLLMIWAFIIACGSPISAIRSGIMISVGFAEYWLDRGALPFNALAFSAWVILILDPQSFFNIGTWLSYTATAGILAQVYSLKLLLIKIPIAAQTATLPLIAQTFQQFPIFFLPLNVIASLCMTFVGLAIGISILIPSLIEYTSRACSLLINYLHHLDSLVPLSLRIRDPNSFTAAVIAGYAWLFSTIIPRNLSQLISGTAILVAIFDLWIKFIW